MIDIISEMVRQHTEKLDSHIRGAMKTHGYVIGENITLDELSERGVIGVVDKTSTLRIDDKNICCWGDSTTYVLDNGNNGVKSVTEFLFKVL